MAEKAKKQSKILVAMEGKKRKSGKYYFASKDGQYFMFVVDREGNSKRPCYRFCKRVSDDSITECGAVWAGLSSKNSVYYSGTFEEQKVFLNLKVDENGNEIAYVSKRD